MSTRTEHLFAIIRKRVHAEVDSLNYCVIWDDAFCEWRMLDDEDLLSTLNLSIVNCLINKELVDDLLYRKTREEGFPWFVFKDDLKVVPVNVELTVG